MFAIKCIDPPTAVPGHNTRVRVPLQLPALLHDGAGLVGEDEELHLLRAKDGVDLPGQSSLLGQDW